MEALQAIPESIRRLISLSATLFIGSGIAVLILIQESISTIIKTTLKLTKPIWSRVLPSPVRKALLKWMEPRIVVSDVLGRKVDPAQVPSFLKNPELGRHKTMRTSDGYKLHYVIKDAQKKTKGKSQLLICLHGFPGDLLNIFQMVHRNNCSNSFAPLLQNSGIHGFPSFNIFLAITLWLL
eukprot:gb/GECG01009022.1/.p1 GENE.gb/GECG01009022.1/~~gb/GECG01009022.1/.p1  ORF type:complete len:181 (+),score=12.28 gb/GECG01009022.1/:1-543(+)